MNDKLQLRNQLKIKRAAFTGIERKEADEAILNYFLKQFSDFESYFIYNSFSSEADTKNIIFALLKAGKRVYLPKVMGENMLAVPCGKTRIGAFGIEEPVGQPFEGDMDITVIPLLAVNSGLFRIGYGKGYYDKYLKDKRTLKVGLGYNFQIAEFNEDGWDIPLDAFVCEKGVFKK